jgi:undecaprenyl diphosphate synthase
MALLIHKVIDIQQTNYIAVAAESDNDYWFLPDNASQADDDHNYCLLSGGGLLRTTNNNACSPCPNEHLVWKVLRWIKLIALKVGRSYYALPAALLLATLLVGLACGFLLGRRYEQKPISKRRERKRGPSLFSAWCLGRLLELQGVGLLCRYAVSFSKSSAKLEHRRGNCELLKPENSGPEKTQNPHLIASGINSSQSDDGYDLEGREAIVRVELKSDSETERESGLSDKELPRHIAVIMDGNRRYGELKHGNAIQGHWEGSRKLLQFAKWCLAENISELTVYAFSTENWQRDAAEVASLMELIARHCEELREQAVEKQICVRVQSTDARAIPTHIKAALSRLEEDTQHCTALQMNICLSYGSRGEIVEACRNLAEDYRSGRLKTRMQINESAITGQMLVSEPDLLIRTSGEVRISNFLLWQLAYAELFFLKKHWPELEKQDLLDVLRSYARGRQRRFGK